MKSVELSFDSVSWIIKDFFGKNASVFSGQFASFHGEHKRKMLSFDAHEQRESCSQALTRFMTPTDLSLKS